MTTQRKRPSQDRWAGRTRDIDVHVPGLGALPVRTAQPDRTQPYLLLHGGAGPASVAAFGDLIASRNMARVIVPTHPGFDGTSRPQGISTMADLASLYVRLLDELDVYDVTVVGNSLGGWLALEIALLDSPRVSGAVVLDAVGAQVDGEPIADVRTLTPDDLVARSFADPSRIATGPGASAPSPEQVQANLAALYTYGGDTMSDPTLLERLRGLEVPVQIIWGAADRIVTPAHARAYADAISTSHLTVLDDAGHLPQLEVPEAVLGLMNDLGHSPELGTQISERTN